MMDIYTPPPSPPSRHGPSQRDRDRDRTRSRRAASPRLKIRRRSFGERPPTSGAGATRHTPSPELIFSMSPIDSHFHPPPPKTTLNPGALLARARQQSSNAFAGLNRSTRASTTSSSRPPLLYSFPKTSSHLRAPPTTSTSRAESRPMRFSPITESSDDGALHIPEPSHRYNAVPMPIAVPLPMTKLHDNSFDSAAYSAESFYGSFDDENEDENESEKAGGAASSISRPPKIVGFDTGTDSDSGESYGGRGRASPFRFERFVPHKALSLDSRDDIQEPVRPLQTRNRG